jgi:hypothetical protein
MYGITPWMQNGVDPVLFILICFIFVAVRSNKNVGGLTDKEKLPGQKNSAIDKSLA